MVGGAPATTGRSALKTKLIIPGDARPCCRFEVPLSDAGCVKKEAVLGGTFHIRQFW